MCRVIELLELLELYKVWVLFLSSNTKKLKICLLLCQFILELSS